MNNQVEISAKTGLPKARKSNPRAPEIDKACADLFESYGSCCITLFREHHPDLAQIFDKDTLRSYLSREAKNLRNQYISEGRSIPHNKGARPGLGRPPRPAPAPAPAPTPPRPASDPYGDDLEGEDVDFDIDREHNEHSIGLDSDSEQSESESESDESESEDENLYEEEVEQGFEGKISFTFSSFLRQQKT